MRARGARTDRGASTTTAATTTARAAAAAALSGRAWHPPPPRRPRLFPAAGAAGCPRPRRSLTRRPWPATQRQCSVDCPCQGGDSGSPESARCRGTGSGEKSGRVGAESNKKKRGRTPPKRPKKTEAATQHALHAPLPHGPASPQTLQCLLVHRRRPKVPSPSPSRRVDCL